MMRRTLACFRIGKSVDVKSLHAKVGELMLENDF